MAASTADRTDLAGVLMDTIPYGVKASQQIYQGIMVMVIAAAGNALVPAADTANGVVVGLSTQNVLGGSNDGDVSCNVQPIGAPDGGRYWELNAVSPTAAAWVGKLAYVADDNTVTLTVGNSVVVGRVVRVSPSIARIDVGSAVLGDKARDLRIVVSPGGMIRMCDPDPKVGAEDTRKCP